MQKPRKRFLSAIVAVAMCLSQFAPVTAYAVESASGITQSEEAPKETDALSTTTTNSDSSATTPAPKSDVGLLGDGGSGEYLYPDRYYSADSLVCEEWYLDCGVRP